MESSGLGRAVVGLMVVVGVVGARVYLKKPASNDPVINVDKGDARMAAAEKEARDRWPEFLESFRQKPKGMTHAVKYGFPVRGSDGKEYIWLEVRSISGGMITGKVDNEPNADVGYKYRETAVVPEKEISDWIVAGPQGIVKGGFQVKVLQSMQGGK